MLLYAKTYSNTQNDYTLISILNAHANDMYDMYISNYLPLLITYINNKWY